MFQMLLSISNAIFTQFTQRCSLSCLLSSSTLFSSNSHIPIFYARNHNPCPGGPSFSLYVTSSILDSRSFLPRNTTHGSGEILGSRSPGRWLGLGWQTICVSSGKSCLLLCFGLYKRAQTCLPHQETGRT